jgi:hypothetical protein
MPYVTALLWVLAGCNGPNANVRIEHQPQHVNPTIDAGWNVGSAILVVDPATLPWPVTFRYTLVDDSGATLGIGRHDSGGYRISQLRGVADSCQYEYVEKGPLYCWRHMDVIGLGDSLFLVDAESPHGGDRDCIYYALVDATADIDALRIELEAKARACRDAD